MPHQFAIAAEDGRFTGTQMQIACTGFHRPAEQAFDPGARLGGRS